MVVLAPARRAGVTITTPQNVLRRHAGPRSCASAAYLKPHTGGSRCAEYSGGVGLTLITGPANAGKVALLLRRYLDALPREPVLIVPNRSDVDQAERDLLRMRPALLGGTIGTFDDLFKRIALGGGETRP